jgi:hypothetical protein
LLTAKVTPKCFCSNRNLRISSSFKKVIYLCPKSKPQSTMKKLLSILLSAGIVMLVACGPSAEEKAAMEKAVQDSIARVQKAMDDSVATVQQAAMEKAKQDSIAAADMEKARKDSMEAAAKKKPMKKTNEQKMKEDKKVLEKQKG